MTDAFTPLGKYQGTRELGCTVEQVYFCKKPPSCPPRRLHHLHSHQQRERVPVVPRPWRHLVLSASGFWPLRMLGTAHWSDCCLTCISLMGYDVENLFVRLFVIAVSSLGKCLSRFFAILTVVVFLLLSFKGSSYIWNNNFCQICLLQTLSFHPSFALLLGFSLQCGDYNSKD